MGIGPKYPCDETGKHAGLKLLCLGLWVRLPPGIQNWSGGIGKHLPYPAEIGTLG